MYIASLLPAYKDDTNKKINKANKIPLNLPYSKYRYVSKPKKDIIGGKPKSFKFTINIRKTKKNNIPVKI